LVGEVAAGAAAAMAAVMRVFARATTSHGHALIRNEGSGRI
jgi:hypothetical protein